MAATVANNNKYILLYIYVSYEIPQPTSVVQNQRLNFFLSSSVSLSLGNENIKVNFLDATLCCPAVFVVVFIGKKNNVLIQGCFITLYYTLPKKKAVHGVSHTHVGLFFIIILELAGENESINQPTNQPTNHTPPPRSVTSSIVSSSPGLLAILDHEGR